MTFLVSSNISCPVERISFISSLSTLPSSFAALILLTNLIPSGINTEITKPAIGTIIEIIACKSVTDRLAPVADIAVPTSPTYKLSFSPVSKCFVYTDFDEVIGFVIVDVFDDRAEIIDIAVDLMHRNKKIGDDLLKRAIEVAKENGCTSISLEVKNSNKPAIKLYTNNGFKVGTMRKKYYSNGTEDAYLMVRKL